MLEPVEDPRNEDLSTVEEGGSGGDVKATAEAAEEADSEPGPLSGLPIDRGIAEFASAAADHRNVVSPLSPTADADEEGGTGGGGGGQVAMLTSPDAVNRALRRKCYIIIALLLVVGTLLAVVVVLVVGRGGGSSSSGVTAGSEAIQGNAQSSAPSASAAAISSSPTEAPVIASPYPTKAPPNEAPPTKSTTKAPVIASSYPTEALPTESTVATATPTPPPTTQSSLRLQQTLDYLTKFDVSEPSTLEAGSSPPSPQYQAAVWIAQMDRRRIPIPITSDAYIFNQRYSLAVLYFSTGGPSWRFDMGWLSERHECQWMQNSFSMTQGLVWSGAHCDSDPGVQDGESEHDPWMKRLYVTVLDFPAKNELVGTLPPEIRHLRYLKSLSIKKNDGISGPLPDQFGELENLRDLTLQSKSLSGKIPRSFANLKKLELLILANNMFSGNSADGDLDFLGDMPALREIILDYNSEITGTLPDLSRLTKLKVLSVTNTGMNGALPRSLSMLKELAMLYLDGCAFEGSLYVLSSMSNLTHVYLEDNQFYDIIDHTFFADMKNLVHLDASNCSLQGTVPAHLFNSTQLEVLDMSMNNLDGELPAEAISNVQESSLQFLSLHTNKISGPIPPSIKELKSLVTLDLSMNQFSNEIPKEIGELTDLSILFLGRNAFNEAPVPEWIRNMTHLNELSLKSSSLTETIPSWFGELTNLAFLDLGENDLTSTIPQSLGNSSGLRVLILNSNRLHGELGLGQLAYLEVLLIDDNGITGNTDEMCVHELIHFVADCATGDDTIDVELNCTCCTLCCSTNTTCNDFEWLGNHKGIWETDYERYGWEFDKGTVFPWLNYNPGQSQP